jgi:DNA-binding transcriptional LysR family regulator
MDWNDLRYLAAVAETGSTLAASQRLKVSQPTVARRIAALEEAIGLRLFDRLASGYRLTGAGEAMLPAALQVERAASAFAAAADGQRRRASGVVRLAAPTVIAELYVAPALIRFRRQYPEIQVELFNDEAMPDLDAGEADIAIRVGARAARGRLIARRLARDRMTLFCSRSYAEAHGCPGGPDDLDGHILLPGAGPIAETPAFTWLREIAGAARFGYPASTVSAHIASVRAGHGIGLMPRRLFGADPDLIACFDAPDEVSVETWLTAPERLRDDPAIRALLDFIGQYRGEGPERFAPEKKSPAEPKPGGADLSKRDD